MLVLKKIAITGGLSSGKTTVCEFFQKRGAYFVSADKIVHSLLCLQTKLGQEIIHLFGKEVVKEDQFDREEIARRAFKDKKLLTSLEGLLHPVVLDEIEKKYEQIKNQKKYTLFIAEIPLLYESESQDRFDIIIVVIADNKIAKERFQKKTHSVIEEFDMRMTHQMPTQKKQAQADFTIFNNGNMQELEKQVEILYKKLT